MFDFPFENSIVLEHVDFITSLLKVHRLGFPKGSPALTNKERKRYKLKRLHATIGRCGGAPSCLRKVLRTSMFLRLN